MRVGVCMRGVYGRERGRESRAKLHSDISFIRPTIVERATHSARLCSSKTSLIKLVFRRINLCNTSTGFLQRNSKKHHSLAEWMKADSLGDVSRHCDGILERFEALDATPAPEMGDTDAFTQHAKIYSCLWIFPSPYCTLRYLCNLFFIQAFHAISSRLYNLC